MIEAMVDAQENVLKSVQGVLRRLLETGAVDALPVAMHLPAGNVAPMLVRDPAALDASRADPLAPVLPINGARVVSQLTLTGHREKLGVVLRACEIRALVELVKFQQAKLDNTLLIGVDCLGTYSVSDYAGLVSPDPALSVGAALRGRPGLRVPSACLPADAAAGSLP